MACLLLCAAWIFVAGYTLDQRHRQAELFPDQHPRARRRPSLYPSRSPCLAAPRRRWRLYFKSFGHEEWFYYYLSGMICLSLVIYSTMRDTQHESAMHRHE